MNHYLVLAALAWASVAAGQHNEHDPRALATNPLDAGSQIAPVLPGLGENHFAITTSSDEAQVFFDQGLKLTYAFNHQEALRSFKEAVRRDPAAAMAYWGWALVLGPNLNLPMQPDVVPQAYEAIQKAVSLKETVSEKERALIVALATRYREDPDAEQAPFDVAYARAMKGVHDRYRTDNDIATLYTASLMNLSPWDYWSEDGQPQNYTKTFLEVLETTLDRDPEHEGALHYYIHAVEPVDPARGETAADLLTGLTPGAGHLVHMPSHIYMQTGRYAEAFEANINAVQADEGYVTACRNQGIYPLTYYPHNIHFLAWAAIMQGKSARALEASRKVAGRVPVDLRGDDWALYQTFLSMPLYTMVRFGMWDEILDEPKPGKNAVYWTGIWHYARGMAYVHTNQLESGAAALAAIEHIIVDPQSTDTFIGYSNATNLLRIASNVLAGELKAKQKDWDGSVVHLDRAVRLEESLLYSEPPDWYYPVRHTLGAVLLEAGRAHEAERVFWQDLKKNRENGFALYGLAQSLRAQGKDDAAHLIQERFEVAWTDADVALNSSRF
ncbi:MAG: hypothetical protein BMS9Abin37_1663 [Acidobacteriota bacterium]|nr:MAG: hypothetical protein BMS9Abin37_1663 [Acidobacteriota bacterium]